MKRFYLYFLLLFSISLHANEQCDLIASIYGAEAGFNYQTMVVKDGSRAYFYSAPDKNCRLATFIISGDQVEVFREIGEIKGVEYLYIRYRDINNQFVTGWVQAQFFQSLKSKITTSKKCANIKEQQIGISFPVKNNHYQIIGNKKANFYSAPDDSCIVDDVFVIPGDQVSGQEDAEGTFILVNYYTSTSEIVRGWIKKERLWQLNHGDSYRNDINPSSLDLAIRVVSLWMNVEYSCHFYEGINNNNRFRLLVREDHQSSRCRGGGGDPATTPVVAYFDIDKITGEVDFDGLNNEL